jgi:hypothetical protein
LRCPQCGYDELTPPVPCPLCSFTGSLSEIEELGHIQYLLEESAQWPEISSSTRVRVQSRYIRRRRELEIELGLRSPPLSLEEARSAARERFRLRLLLTLLADWVTHGWIKPDAARILTTQTEKHVDEIRARLSEPNTPSVTAFDSGADRVALLKSLLDNLDRLHQENAWTDDSTYQAAITDLEQRAERLEMELGLRRPREEPAPTPLSPAAPPPPSSPPRKPREPITWERVWSTMLSERTLRALLFVGVFLLFASAVTLVAYNWERFSPLVQVVFLTGFTLLFYGLGWYVRAKMGLQLSGVALFATGSLLVPVDFYAIYLSGGVFPSEAWAEVWLTASVTCLVVYTATAIALRAEFFGYLTGMAVGSLACAALQVAAAPGDWWSPTLNGLSLLLMLLSQWKGTRFFSGNLSTGFQDIFARPFRHLGLVVATSVLLLATGLQMTSRFAQPSSYLALALDWWLACGVYVLAAAWYPRQTLSSAACITPPVALYLTLALFFEPTGLGPAWYAMGWALLVPLYLVTGWALQKGGTLAKIQQQISKREPLPPPESASSPEQSTPDAKLRLAQGRTVTTWAVALILLSAAWSLRNMSAAAATHAVMIGNVVLAVVLWQRPRLLLFSSLFSLSTATTWMAVLGLDLAEYSLGWALLAILHIIGAVLLRRAERHTSFLFAAGYSAAALSLLPPVVALNLDRLAYAMGNWIALCGWTAWLAHDRRKEEEEKEHPGLHRLLHLAGPLRQAILHWTTALPLPVWFGLVWIKNVRPADAWLGVGLAVLAWACIGLGRWLAHHDRTYSPPWYTVSFVCSVIAPIIAGGYRDQLLLAVTLLSSAILYFSYARIFHNRWWLLGGGLTLPFGYTLGLDYLGLSSDPLAAALTLVPTLYILSAIWLERRRGINASFLEPIYGVAHVVAITAFLWGFGGLWNRIVWNAPWSDEARLWAAGGHLMLGMTYGLAAWYLEEKIWGHVAAWLGVFAGGLVATVFSQGRGSSAAKAALLAIVYVGAERALYALRERHSLPHRAWALYRKPLLIAGWAVSAGTVILALLRNLWFLGGGPVREDWAIIGLLMIVGLYVVSARLFRRSIFLWLGAVLLFSPWTLLTHRGWYIWEQPPVSRYALAWVVLAWALMLAGLSLDRFANRRYGLPFRFTAHVLLPFALLWGGADPSTSSATYGLGLAFYTLTAVIDHRQGRTGLAAARSLYPTALLAAIWPVYLLAWRGPWLPCAHFGLLLLALSPAAFAAARALRRIDPADAVPLYLASYGCAIVGTMLVGYDRALLALALVFDAGLALTSARLLHEPLWIYPAAALPPAALLLVLAEINFAPHRRGWWLIGLGAVYLVQSWALRRLSPSSSPTGRENGKRYAIPLMAVAYAIITLGLPISSYEQIAAFWGYGGAAIIYVLSAVWLRKPLLLTPAIALAAVPYAVLIDRATWIEPADYGLAMWPGIAIALGVAHLLDHYVGAPRDFPWGRPTRWLSEAARRLTGWWGLLLYGAAYVGALVSAGLSLEHPAQLMVTLMLAAVTYGLATVRFRLRCWLLIAVTTAQAAALATIGAAARSIFPLPQAWMSKLALPGWQALAFLPVTLATAVTGLAIERWRREGSPFASFRALWSGWSRPLYWLLALDLSIGQIFGSLQAHPGTLISLTHALTLAVLAVTWVQPMLSYLVAGLGLLATFQRLFWIDAPSTDAPVALALLALGYGLIGYSLEHLQTLHSPSASHKSRSAVLERPLQQSGLFISAIATFSMLAQGIDIWRWLARSLLGRPLMAVEDVPVVQMAVAVLALVGLLYLAAALVRRWYWRGYGAVALLLCAWSLEWFLVWGLREVQWYAIPAGLYLLGVGYLEWRQDRRQLARWIDRAAMLLLLGSSFYQSLAEQYGWPYVLLMGGESLFLIWWGSARRQRRFLYLGVIGVVTDVGGQLIEPLLSVNRWIVFGGVGLFVISVAILVERSLETVKQVSRELQERLETWE